MSEYIGNLIKIVDKKDDVYVGFLAKISAETSTVELTSVTLNPNSKNSQKLESIQLNGSDVQDLQVLDSTQKTQHSKEHNDNNKTPDHDAKTNTNEESDSNEPELDDDDFYTRTQRLTEKDGIESSGAKSAYNKEASFFDDLQPSNWGGNRGGRGRGRGRGGRGGRGRGRGGSRGGFNDSNPWGEGF